MRIDKKKQVTRHTEVKQEKKREELDDNRMKSRSILLQALVQGMKSDDHTRLHAASAKKKINVCSAITFYLVHNSHN